MKFDAVLAFGGEGRPNGLIRDEVGRKQIARPSRAPGRVAMALKMESGRSRCCCPCHEHGDAETEKSRNSRRQPWPVFTSVLQKKHHRGFALKSNSGQHFGKVRNRACDGGDPCGSADQHPWLRTPMRIDGPALAQASRDRAQPCSRPLRAKDSPLRMCRFCDHPTTCFSVVS